MDKLIKKLSCGEILTKSQFKDLIDAYTPENAEKLAFLANEKRQQIFSNNIYVRGLIEFTNYCKNNCYYCGIRRDNKNVTRYRLSKEDILLCCDKGYKLGFRTFVLQGGEDNFFTDDKLCEIISEIKNLYPDCAVTLSMGERTLESYQKLFNAGADRYLLRHETANCEHYSSLHPKELTLSNRMECLENLKNIGYQVGCGFMVGSPNQTNDFLAEDLYFLQNFKPHMVGIGPFIPQKDTPFANKTAGTLEKTLYLLSIIRLMLPDVLLPATTALGTIHPKGRELGILSGANVIMPNLSPEIVRGKYTLYDNKLYTGDEAAENLKLLREKLQTIDCKVCIGRGDSPKI